MSRTRLTKAHLLGRGYTAGALSGAPDEGIGGHWWYQLAPPDWTTHQLLDRVESYREPNGW